MQPDVFSFAAVFQFDRRQEGSDRYSKTVVRGRGFFRLPIVGRIKSNIEIS